jgi:hypothetical protein
LSVVVIPVAAVSLSVKANVAAIPEAVRLVTCADADVIDEIPVLTAETTVDTDVVVAAGVNDNVNAPAASVDVVAVRAVPAGVTVPVAVTVAPPSLLPN